ncbi:MFS transporter [Aestuariivirga litoralis]|uniref:MFS transporter n=1 Tax=Aestuariivirga litoralis TaxID=2650924 RepID=A0A2W2AVV4_9HYPH|nr:MFS transporter [Aestuariivirga litoralis]PZF77842.1 MFS transporter [Aestuariivirga litoralis]
MVTTHFTPAKVQGTTYAVLFAVTAGHLINDTLQALLLSIYPLLRDLHNLSFAQVGFITMAFQATASVLQPLIGHYTDKKPFPFSLPIAPALSLVGLVVVGLAHSYEMILVGATLIGIGSSIFHPEASRLARLSSGGRFGFAQSVFQVGGNFGTSIGPLLAAFFVVPHGQGSVAWLALLALFSVAILSYAAKWYAHHLSPKNGVKRGHVPPNPLPRRMVMTSLTVLLCLMFSKFVYTSSMSSFYTFYLIDTFGLSPKEAQIDLFIYLAAFAAGTLLGGPIGDRIGRKAVIWFSVLGALPFTLALPYANHFWAVMLSVPIGFILASAFSAMLVFAQELMPGRVGMISGLFFGLAFGIAAAGAALLGVIADWTSIGFVFHVCSFLPAFGLLAMFLPSQKQLAAAQGAG